MDHILQQLEPLGSSCSRSNTTSPGRSTPQVPNSRSVFERETPFYDETNRTIIQESLPGSLSRSGSKQTQVSEEDNHHDLSPLAPIINPSESPTLNPLDRTPQQLNNHQSTGRLIEPMRLRTSSARMTPPFSNHQETLIVANHQSNGKTTTLNFREQTNMQQEDAPRDVAGIMKSVGLMVVTFVCNNGFEIVYHGASFARIGLGISISALHTFEVEPGLLSFPNLKVKLRSLHGFKGSLDEEAFDSEQVGYSMELLTSPLGSSVPFYINSKIGQDICLLKDCDVSEEYNDQEDNTLYPGVLLDDKFVRLLTCNGNPTYRDAIKAYQKANEVISIDREEFFARKRQLLPNHISFVEGRGEICGPQNEYILHDISTLAGANGGILLNSKNQLIGVHNGGIKSIGDDSTAEIGTRNVAVNLNTDALKSFFRRSLIPRLPLDSQHYKCWTEFCAQ